MTWLHPEAWPWLLAVPLVAAALWVGERRRARARDRVLGPRAALLTSNGAASRRIGWFVAGLFFACLALLEPAWGTGTHTVEERGVDLVVCLDVSRSMLARDDRPDRLRRAQAEIEALAERAQGDRLALVVFAGDARLVVPRTRDRDSFAAMAALANPLSVERGGSNLGLALRTAMRALDGATGEHEAIVLVTDGEDLEGEGLREARTCAQRGITVHTVGMGSRLGAKIPVESEGGEAFLRDAAGADVVTAMDPVGLERIAEVTGGSFIVAVDEARPLVALYDEAIEPMARKSFETREKKERANRYQWPLLAAVVCWMLDLWLGVRRS